MSDVMQGRAASEFCVDKRATPTILRSVPIKAMQLVDLKWVVRLLALPALIIILSTIDQFHCLEFVNNHSHNSASNRHLPNLEASSRSFKIHGHHARQLSSEKYHHPRLVGANKNGLVELLPSGPPPFRPTTLLLGLNSWGGLKKLKRTKLYKRMYKSKVYYLFLDVLEQLTLLVDKIAHKKIDITSSKVATIQAIAGKLLLKGGQQLKLKWPLVMLNPHFLKELLASPTFLVMLFHAIEVAYMSTPMTFWLKPLVKLVKQASPEKEEEVWWRRKRIYEVLNGHGSSELEPSLKAIHFKNPGELPAISLSNYVNAFRQLTKKSRPRPDYHRQPSVGHLHQQHGSHQVYPEQVHEAPLEIPPAFELTQPDAVSASRDQGMHEQFAYHDDRPIAHSHSDYMSHSQEEAFLANQIGANPAPTKQTKLVPADSMVENSFQHSPPNPWPPAYQMQHQMTGDSASQFMSQAEFDLLEPHEKQLVLRETRQSEREARLAEELIRQQSEFVNSFAQRQDGTLALVPQAAFVR